MRHAIYLCATALLFYFATSCSKNIINPHPRKPGDSVLSIDLIFPATDSTTLANPTELIISEPGGKILLDSIVPYNTPVIAKMKTHQLFVDVTTVSFFAAAGDYTVGTTISAQPELWRVIPQGQVLPTLPNGTPTTVTYTHSPLFDFNSHFATLAVNNAGITTNYDNTDSVLTVGYEGLASDNVAYLLFPNLGTYSYQTIPSNSQTISLSHMNTTEKVFFDAPAQYSLASCLLTGYADTTDFTKNIDLYLNFQHFPLGDLQYPPHSKVPIQKYWLQVEASTANNEFVAFNGYGSTGPTGTLSLPFPASPIYTLNSNIEDSLSVSFSQKPTNWGASWLGGNVIFGIGAPPDSTVIHPLSLLNSLHSKLLAGHMPTSLSIQNFSYEIIPGLDYNGFNKQTSSTEVLSHPLFANNLLYLLFFD
jgi:hypothetical protein